MNPQTKRFLNHKSKKLSVAEVVNQAQPVIHTNSFIVNTRHLDFFYDLSYKFATSKNITTLKDEFISKGNTVWQEKWHRKMVKKLKSKKEEGSAN